MLVWSCIMTFHESRYVSPDRKTNRWKNCQGRIAINSAYSIVLVWPSAISSAILSAVTKAPLSPTVHRSHSQRPQRPRPILPTWRLGEDSQPKWHSSPYFSHTSILLRSNIICKCNQHNYLILVCKLYATFAGNNPYHIYIYMYKCIYIYIYQTTLFSIRMHAHAIHTFSFVGIHQSVSSECPLSSIMLRRREKGLEVDWPSPFLKTREGTWTYLDILGYVREKIREGLESSLSKSLCEVF